GLNHESAGRFFGHADFQVHGIVAAFGSASNKIHVLAEKAETPNAFQTFASLRGVVQLTFGEKKFTPNDFIVRRLVARNGDLAPVDLLAALDGDLKRDLGGIRNDLGFGN